MPLISTVKIRQPARGDLVGDAFVVAGVGSGSEGTIGLRVLDASGRVIGTASAQNGIGLAGVGEYHGEITLDRSPRNGATIRLEAFGDNPGLPDEGPSPGFDLVGRDLVYFKGLRGWLLYRVVAGDTLSSIVGEVEALGKTSVTRIVAANKRITDPDLIQVGWRLKIPLVA